MLALLKSPKPLINMSVRLRHTLHSSFAPAEHLEFVKNRRRNAAFRRALERHAPGRTVLDVGTGSGLLAIYAARAGARRVYAMEKDTTMVQIARANFERNKLADRIELIHANALSADRFPRADIVVGEMLSTWCVVEPQVPVIRRVLDALPHAIPIPSQIFNRVQGVQARFGDVDSLVEISTTYFEFRTSEKALSLTHLVRASDIAFSARLGLDVELRLPLRIARHGLLNALRLISITETAPRIRFGPTDDTMPAMIVPFPSPIRVHAGQLVSVHITYTYGHGWNHFSIHRISGGTHA